MTTKIPVSKPLLPNLNLISEILKEIDANRIYTNNGPILNRYENLMAEYLNVPSDRVVILANATLGLQGSIQTCDAQSWIVPNFTFIATGLSVIQSGRELIICDVSTKDWQLDATLIEKFENTTGIMPVMPFGAPPDFKKWSNYEYVIIDAAASLGASKLDLKDIGPEWTIVYSLHATKVLPAAEGCVVVCGSSKKAEKLRFWANFGFDKSRTTRLIGTNAKMSEYSAAIGLTSLLNHEIESRDWIQANKISLDKKISTYYSTPVNNYPGFRPYWILDFKDKQTNNRVIEILEKNSVGYRKWWHQPLSAMSIFRDSKFIGGNNSEILADSTLGLPMFRDIRQHEVDFINDILENV